MEDTQYYFLTNRYIYTCLQNKCRHVSHECAVVTIVCDTITCAARDKRIHEIIMKIASNGE